MLNSCIPYVDADCLYIGDEAIYAEDREIIEDVFEWTTKNWGMI